MVQEPASVEEALAIDKAARSMASIAAGRSGRSCAPTGKSITGFSGEFQRLWGRRFYRALLLFLFVPTIVRAFPRAWPFSGRAPFAASAS